jgi:hypothetical protein
MGEGCDAWVEAAHALLGPLQGRKAGGEFIGARSTLYCRDSEPEDGLVWTFKQHGVWHQGLGLLVPRPREKSHETNQPDFT